MNVTVRHKAAGAGRDTKRPSLARHSEDRGPNLPTCDRHHSEQAHDVLYIKSVGAIMSTILTYNPVLIDDRNDQPFLKAFVAILAVLTVALLIAVA